jgi:hypothetical protein
MTGPFATAGTGFVRRLTPFVGFPTTPAAGDAMLPAKEDTP